MPPQIAPSAEAVLNNLYPAEEEKKERTADRLFMSGKVAFR